MRAAACIGEISIRTLLLRRNPPLAGKLLPREVALRLAGEGGKKMPPCGAAAAWFRKVLWRSNGAVFALAARLPLPRGQACHTKARQQ